MSRKQFNFSTVIVISFIAALSIKAQSQKQSDGYVIFVDGSWNLKTKLGSTKIIKGMAVSSGDVITANSEGSKKITIALNDGTALSQICPSDKCKNRITIPTINQMDETSKLLLEALFADDRSLDIAGATRGKKLIDCVIRKSKDQVNLAPLLRGYDEGDINLTFVPFASNGKPVTSSQLKKSVNVPKPMDSEFSISFIDLQYGLYLVSTPETSEALVLVTSEDKYPTLAGQLQRAAYLIAKWGKDKQISLRAQRRYKQKWLYALAYPKT